jgi:hypothetical protein
MKIKDMDIEDFKILIKQTIDESLENYFEDIDALGSKKYLKDIKNSRQEFLNN